MFTIYTLYQDHISNLLSLYICIEMYLLSAAIICYSMNIPSRNEWLIIYIERDESVQKKSTTAKKNGLLTFSFEMIQNLKLKFFNNLNLFAHIHNRMLLYLISFIVLHVM